MVTVAMLTGNSVVTVSYLCDTVAIHMVFVLIFNIRGYYLFFFIINMLSIYIVIWNQHEKLINKNK